MPEFSSTPLVSIVIPVRNGFHYIQESIESILNQCFHDFEILIINDGSEDGDYEKLNNLDTRIHVHHLSGKGVSSARNHGMQLARGEFIAFLDADDVWCPGKLQAQINYFNMHYEVGVVFGRFMRWEKGPSGNYPAAADLMQDCSHLVDCEKSRSGWIYTRLLQGLLVGMNTAMIRRSVFESIGGFNVSLRQGEDSDFWLKASHITEMHALNGCVALYRIHSSSAMHQLSKENALLNVLHAAYLRWGLEGPANDVLALEKFSQRMAQIQFDHGYAHFWGGDLVVSRKSFLKALKAGHRSFRSMAYIILSSLPVKLKNL